MSTDPSLFNRLWTAAATWSRFGDVAAHRKRAAPIARISSPPRTRCDETLRAGNRRERPYESVSSVSSDSTSSVGDHDVGARARERQRVGPTEAS